MDEWRSRYNFRNIIKKIKYNFIINDSTYLDACLNFRWNFRSSANQRNGECRGFINEIPFEYMGISASLGIQQEKQVLSSQYMMSAKEKKMPYGHRWDFDSKNASSSVCPGCPMWLSLKNCYNAWSCKQTIFLMSMLWMLWLFALKRTESFHLSFIRWLILKAEEFLVYFCTLFQLKLSFFSETII